MGVEQPQNVIFQPYSCTKFSQQPCRVKDREEVTTLKATVVILEGFLKLLGLGTLQFHHMQLHLTNNHSNCVQ